MPKTCANPGCRSGLPVKIGHFCPANVCKQYSKTISRSVSSIEFVQRRLAEKEHLVKQFSIALGSPWGVSDADLLKSLSSFGELRFNNQMLKRERNELLEERCRLRKRLRETRSELDYAVKQGFVLGSVPKCRSLQSQEQLGAFLCGGTPT